MTKPRDPENLLAAYLTEGIDVLPDRVAKAILEEAHRTRRRTLLRPWWTRSVFKAAFGAAVVVAVVLGGGLFLIQRGQPGVGGPGPTPSPSASPSQVAVGIPEATPTETPSPTPEATPTAVPEPTPAETPSPTPAETPSPTPTPFVVPGGREWTVTVVNDSSDPGTLFVAEDGKTGMGPQCGTVNPAVVPAGVTTEVTFLLPPKRVTDCWIWVNPVPGQGGSLFQTSDAPMRGKIVFMQGEGGRSVGAWAGP